MKKSLFLIPLFITIVLLLPLTDCTHSSSGGSYDDGVIHYTIPEAAAYISTLTENETYTIVIEDTSTKSCEALYEALLGLTFTTEDGESYEGPYIILDLSKATALTEIEDSGLQGYPKGSHDPAYSYALKEVILPENCTSIGIHSFQAQASLEKVTFPKSLVSIEMSAFAHCTSLKEVDFSSCTKLEKIGDCAFQYCESLEKVDLSVCKKLDFIGQDAFNKDSNLKEITIYSGDTMVWAHDKEIGLCNDSGDDCLALENPTEDDDIVVVPCFEENAAYFLTPNSSITLNCTCEEGCEENGCDCQTLKNRYDYHWYKVEL